MTTPKLKTSLLRLYCPDMATSGALYPELASAACGLYDMIQFRKYYNGFVNHFRNLFSLINIFITSESGLAIRSANPESDRWGFRSPSSRIFDDLKFLWSTDGEHVSCKYLTT